jgi:hypothetical protein
MDSPLSILYTHNLRGNVELLPRLHTFLRQLHKQAQRFEDEDDVLVCQLQPPARRVLFVDVGESCAPDVWHCAATGGRSMLLVLDAMGYHAAGVALTSDDREKLSATAQLALVDDAHPYLDNGVGVATAASAAALQPRPGVTLILSPETTARLSDGWLYPARLNAGQVGVAHVSFASGAACLSGHDIFDMPATTRPDPAISGTVDFVLGEARLYQKKQAQ